MLLPQSYTNRIYVVGHEQTGEDREGDAGPAYNDTEEEMSQLKPLRVPRSSLGSPLDVAAAAAATLPADAAGAEPPPESASAAGRPGLHSHVHIDFKPEVEWDLGISPQEGDLFDDSVEVSHSAVQIWTWQKLSCTLSTLHLTTLGCP